jgi:uncharacterized protein (TIGR04141 family)
MIFSETSSTGAPRLPGNLRICPRVYPDVPLHHVCPTRPCWENVNEPIIASIEAAHAAARKRESELEVAFAFLGDWRGKTITSLPLFSRISMVNEARRVSNLGFKPTVALISTR